MPGCRQDCRCLLCRELNNGLGPSGKAMLPLGAINAENFILKRTKNDSSASLSEDLPKIRKRSTIGGGGSFILKKIFNMKKSEFFTVDDISYSFILNQNETKIPDKLFGKRSRNPESSILNPSMWMAPRIVGEIPKNASEKSEPKSIQDKTDPINGENKAKHDFSQVLQELTQKARERPEYKYRIRVPSKDTILLDSISHESDNEDFTASREVLMESSASDLGRWFDEDISGDEGHFGFTEDESEYGSFFIIKTIFFFYYI